MIVTTPKPDVFTALADATRRQILIILAEEPLPVRQLSERFPVTRPAISRHLRILKEAGLVRDHKRGRKRLYAVQPEQLNELRRWIDHFDSHWKQSLNELKSYVEERHE